jgi:hypothetical protein
MIISPYIKNIMDLLVDDDEYRLLYRPQLDYITDDKYDYTNGSGLFVTFTTDDRINTLPQNKDTNVIDGVTIKSIENGLVAKAILHIKNGLIDSLEIWCVTNNYPDHDLKKYTLQQDWIGSSNRQIVVDK